MVTKQEFLDALEKFMYSTCLSNWEWTGKDTHETQIEIKLSAWRFKEEEEEGGEE